MPRGRKRKSSMKFEKSSKDKLKCFEDIRVTRRSGSLVEPVIVRLERAISETNNYKAIEILTSSKAADVITPKSITDIFIKTCRNGMLPTVRVLIEKGAKVSKKSSNHCTPLAAAIEGGHVDLAYFLLMNGADVNQPSEYDNTALMLAIMKQFLHSLIVDLIKAGAAVDARNKFGKTAVMIAIERYDFHSLMILINSGAKLKMTDIHQKSAFDLAAENNILEIVLMMNEHRSLLSLVNRIIESNQVYTLRKLIYAGLVSWDLNENNKNILMSRQNYGENDNFRNDDNCAIVSETSSFQKLTPLFQAAASGNKEMVTMLINAGFCVNLSEKDGKMTALMVAAKNGHTKIVKLLLKKGAEINAVSEIEYSALTNAVKEGHYQCVQMLLKLGANINKKLDFTVAAEHNQKKCIQLLSEHINISDLDTDVLLAAVRSSHYNLTEFLIKKGMDVNSFTFSGESVLMQSRNAKMAKLLVKNGASVHFTGSLFSANDNDEDIDNKEWIIEFLLKNGANANAMIAGDHPALISAAHCNKVNIARLLLEAGAQPDVTTHMGDTALMLAAQRDYIPLMKLLLEKGANINLQSKNGFSALMYASMNSWVESVKLLLDHAADVHLEDVEGNTALLLSTDSDVVRLLVAAGADLNKENKEGLTPVKLAKDTNRFSLLKTIESLNDSDDFL